MISCQDEWLQKRERSLLLTAIQPSVAAISTPTSGFSSEQLDARRKYEILKRRNRLPGETNPRLTKAQIWSRLNSVVADSGPPRVDVPRSRRVPCAEEYYDLSVPLVGFNEPMPPPPPIPLSTQHIDGDIAFYAFNEITHLSRKDVSISEDSDTSVNEIRHVTAGYIIVPKYYAAEKPQVQFSIPISLWFYYVHGGVHTTVDGTPIVSGLASRNVLLATDKIVMDVVSIQVILTFNNKEISIAVPDIQYDLSTFTATNIKPNDNNYVMEYVGTLFVNRLLLPRRPNAVYGVRLKIEYSYSIPNAFDVFQTGIVVNATRAQRSDSSSSDIVVRLVPDVGPYKDGSFALIYDSVTYQSLTIPVKYVILVLRDNDYVLLQRDSTLSPYQTRSSDVGTIAIPLRTKFATTAIIVAIPIALWFYYALNNDSKIDKKETITMTVATIEMIITYTDDDGVPHAFDTRPIIQRNLQSLIATNLAQGYDDQNNYGIQYIGMIDISNVHLVNTYRRQYRLHLIVTYSCALPRDKIEFFQSGVYINPSSPATVCSSKSIRFLTETDTVAFKLGTFN